nr:sulfotransferase family 2 domain-containing protein [Pseudomaricurvus alcaniphilus]
MVVIVCHSRKFIFIKTQKTAGTSMEIALSELCNEGDVITPITKSDENIRQALGFLGPQNFSLALSKYSKSDLLDLVFSAKLKRFYNHISCDEVKSIIGKEVYNSYYKFCFERNPYDKAISLFYHEGGVKKWGAIENFICSGGLDIVRGYDQYTIKKVLAVDDVFRYEEMAQALQSISSSLGLGKCLSLPEKKAKSEFRKDKRHYSEVLSSKEKELIDVIWAREKKLMSYEF